MKTAILIDGGFFIKRYKHIKGFSSEDSPDIMARNLVRYCFRHISRINSYRKRYDLHPTELHRIYFYDARPFDGDSQNPVTRKTISFRNTATYAFKQKLFDELKRQRKIALRLGFLKNSSKAWLIKGPLTKPLIAEKITAKDITSNDVIYPLKQKGVDIKIGLDIATLAFKKQVGQMILIAGDSDFVPVAKFARQEGVDLILDPMLNNIDPKLHEHIDGLITIKDMRSANSDSG